MYYNMAKPGKKWFENMTENTKNKRKSGLKLEPEEQTIGQSDKHILSFGHLTLMDTDNT